MQHSDYDNDKTIEISVHGAKMIKTVLNILDGLELGIEDHFIV